MVRLIYLLVFFLGIISCRSQTGDIVQDRVVGGPCEGCEAVLEYEERKLKSIDTLPEFLQTNPKLKITGRVYENDGKTVASDVILYAYHTDKNGLYTADSDAEGWAKRHGKYRSWVKINDVGRYAIYTFRPAPYPNRPEPAHIHFTVKETGLSPYYIDSVVFEDDPLLTPEEKERLPNRGGSGVVLPILKDGIWVVERDIILGKHIPDY